MRFDPGPGMGGHCLPGRPVLPVLAGARVRLRPPSSSSSPARSTRRCPTSASSGSSGRSTTPASRCAGRGSRCSGVAYKPGVGDMRESPGAEDPRAAARARRRGRLPRPARARAAAVRPAQRGRSTTALDGADLAVIVTAHPELDHRARRRATRRWWSTCAASRAASTRRAWCGCERRRRSRVGVVGLGYWGPNLARNFDGAARVRAALVCDASERGARARRRRRSRDARVTGELDDLLADPRARRGRRSPPPCRRTPSSPCACSRPASTASWRSRWRSRSPTPSARSAAAARRRTRADGRPPARVPPGRARS